MADEKILDLKPLVTPSTTDLYETSANGTGSFRETRAQMTAYMQANAAAAINTVYYSTKGSDVNGTGSPISPFATPNAALNYALGLSPTVSSPVVIMGDAGIYQITDQHLIYPNIIWRASGKLTWTTNGSVTQITLASASHWGTSACFAFIDEFIVIDSTLQLYLDASAIPGSSAHINFTLNLNCTTFKGVYQKATTNQTFNINALERANLGATDTGSSPTTIDSVYFAGFPGFSINPSGSVNLLATNQPTNLIGTGNAGIGTIAVTSSTTIGNNITVNQTAGNVLNFNGGINASNAGGVSLQLDATTTPQNLLQNITGTNYSFVNLSTQNYYSQVLLTDGASVPWDATIAPSALWILSGSGHTLQNITSLTTGQFIQICIQQNSTGGYTPLFGSNYRFPLGTPTINTGAYANTILQFYLGTETGTGTIVAICTTPGASGGSGTVNSGTVNQLAWYASTGTAVSGLSTANNAVLVTNGSGAPSLSTTLPYVQFTNNSIVATGTIAMNQIYYLTNNLSYTLTLPAIMAVGQWVEFRVDDSGGQIVIGQLSGQSIIYGTAKTTTGTSGALILSNQGDSVRLECIVANTKMIVTNSQGTLGYL